ncbi:MAG: hypothetical protein ABIJ56_00225 [Pseudomonadota bacterium]
MKHRTGLSAAMAVFLLFPCARASADTTLVEDPLNGSTVGVEDGGGAFVEGGGWHSTGGKIVYDAGKVVTDGYFECRMRGWTAPAQGIDKAHPLSGWEVEDEYGHWAQTGSFWNWRIGTGYNPFKVLSAPLALDSRVEARVGDNGAVNGTDQHTYRVDWQGAVIQFIFDGGLLQEWTFDRFQVRYFCIGRDDQYGITNPAPIISDCVIVDREAGEPPTIAGIITGADCGEVGVAFGVPVLESDAVNTANYAVDRGITVLDASLGVDLMTVTLATTPHAGGVTYTLTVNNIRDRTAEALEIAPDTQATYSFSSCPAPAEEGEPEPVPEAAPEPDPETAMEEIMEPAGEPADDAATEGAIDAPGEDADTDPGGSGHDVEGGCGCAIVA